MFLFYWAILHYSVLFDGKRIISGSLDTTIIVWSVETGAVIHKLVGHQSLTSGMQVKGHTLVSGNADSSVKIWSLQTGECLHTLNGRIFIHNDEPVE